MEIIEALENGIELLVLQQYGIIEKSTGMTCSNCNKDLQKDLNCAFGDFVDLDEPIIILPYNNTEYYSCPISMIPKIVYDLYDEYMFIQEFNPQQSQKDTPNMLWWFIKTYKSIKAKIDHRQHEERMKEVKSNT